MKPVDPPDVQLTMQIDGDSREPTRVITLDRPNGGKVRVREWTSDDWKQARESYRDAADLLDEIERAIASRRRVSADLVTVRHWLTGS
ncbi:MAG: hypothetical protein M3081_02230 [Gemmatimonadota bacterium]|nr:hypothetical protein [Gemmatimonadota bacterium]